MTEAEEVAQAIFNCYAQPFKLVNRREATEVAHFWCEDASQEMKDQIAEALWQLSNK